MKILTCLQGEATVLKIRLFNAVKPSEDDYIDLTEYSRYEFRVLEAYGSGNRLLIHKDDSSIVVSTDAPQTPIAYPDNIISISLAPADTVALVPNPPDRDRLRFWQIRGQNSVGNWVTIDKGNFYVDSLTAA